MAIKTETQICNEIEFSRMAHITPYERITNAAYFRRGGNGSFPALFHGSRGGFSLQREKRKPPIVAKEERLCIFITFSSFVRIFLVKFEMGIDERVSHTLFGHKGRLRALIYMYIYIFFIYFVFLLFFCRCTLKRFGIAWKI